MEPVQVDLRMYLHKNLGDDLFLRLVAARYPEAVFHVRPICRYEPGEYPANVVMHDAHTRLSENPLINKALTLLADALLRKRYDVTAVVGGSMFQEPDYWRYFRPLLWPCGRLRDPFVVLGCNFGPFRSAAFVRKYRKLFSRARDVCFRDRASYARFADLPSARVAPDIAFSVAPEDSPCASERKMLISVMDLSWRETLRESAEAYERGVAALIWEAQARGYRVELMSFCRGEGDEDAMARILHRLDETAVAQVETYCYRGDLDGALAELRSCEILVASRFHATILGLLFGKKVLPVIYNEKTRNVLHDLGFQGQALSVSALDALDADALFSGGAWTLDAEAYRREAQMQFTVLDELLRGCDPVQAVAVKLYS